MPAKKFLSLGAPKSSNDADALLDAEWDERTWPSKCPELEPLDAQLPASCLHLRGSRTNVSSNVGSVDSLRSGLTIHNAFFVEGKVPSLNELLDAKGGSVTTVRSIIMRRIPQKGKQRGARFDLYNELKQDWTTRTIRSLPKDPKKVDACYFGYVIVEENHRRDPSNICSAAIKFIEDGLVKAGVLPNDGWQQVLGIRLHWIHRTGRPAGVYVVLSERAMDEGSLVEAYEEWFLLNGLR